MCTVRLLYSICPCYVTYCIDNLVLDLVGLAIGYGLPHLPKMPELKDKDTSRFISHTISASSIPYKDKAREKKRKQQLLQKQGLYVQSTQRVSSCYYGIEWSCLKL